VSRLGQCGHDRNTTISLSTRDDALEVRRLILSAFESGGRVPNGPDLAMAGHPETFVVGDMAKVIAAHGSAVPGVRPAPM